MENSRMHDYEVVYLEDDAAFAPLKVMAADKIAAAAAACREWGLGQKEGLCRCSVRDLGRHVTYPCRRCGKQVDKPGYCYECQQAVEAFRRQMSGVRGRRHTGYRGRR